MKHYHRALTIAGSDSGGGAGIQADLKTFAALGCYGFSVITALTAQNTRGVTAIESVPAHFVEQQMEAVLTDIGVDAVKIGMIHSPEIIGSVAATLQRYRAPNIVLDPVMIAKSGDRLLQKEAVQALAKLLLPLAAVITPNLPEAAVLLGRPLERLVEMEQAARDLARLGPAAILLKGGHLGGERSPDLLYQRQEDRVTLLDGSRVQTANTHGTGCTLSSAIAAGLARGLALAEAVRRAKEYLTGALQRGAAYRLGSGHGPVHHFWEHWS
ncbi:MAG: bifunctional hydroxymethylpyrimidine kinase/phosphomethylpyrimidine kinase [Firmicutes bacterium]|jgi:hydroxymethylpyrimidine/phosphomethylpyrimidine kinase|nr:bifunctional hydroxymethylpyrimidine kinase/phosphomethylpyrimidine kinase [Bacillota bacterium]